MDHKHARVQVRDSHVLDTVFFLGRKLSLGSRSTALVPRQGRDLGDRLLDESTLLFLQNHLLYFSSTRGRATSTK